MSSNHDRVLDYYVPPWMSFHYLVRTNSSWLRARVRLHRLSDFYATATKMWAERFRKDILTKYLVEL